MKCRRFETACSGESMHTRNSSAPKLSHRRQSLIPRWKLFAPCALALAFLAQPIHAQLKVKPEVGPTAGPACPIEQPDCASMPMTPTIGQLTPTILPDDEKRLPWNLSAAQANPTSVKALKVPSKAKNEYAKACTTSQKKNYQESEQHLRRAIEKYNDYPAAWGVVW